MVHTDILPEQLAGKKQGNLSIFASYFSGAGKSYAMLETAKQARQAGRDVVIGLLSCESSEIFLRFFKDSLNGLIRSQFVNQDRKANTDIPQDFLINHISGSFVEMVLWWIKGRMKQTPADLDRYFRAVIEPIM